MPLHVREALVHGLSTFPPLQLRAASHNLAVKWT